LARPRRYCSKWLKAEWENWAYSILTRLEPIEELIETHEAWNKPEQAEHWRAKLSQQKKAENR